MWPLSQHASELLTKLHEKSGFVSRLFGQAGTEADLIDQLGELKEVAIIPHLAYFIGRFEASAAPAYRAVSKILDEPRAEDLLDLDEQLRHSYYWGQSESWRRIKAYQLRHMDMAESDAHAVFGMLSSHPDGYVREAAVRRLDQLSDGRELPYLLIRLNDWVAPVRKIAQESVLRRLNAGELNGFYRNLHLVFRLSDCGRADHSIVVDSVMEHLAAPESGDSLAAALEDSSRFVRRRTYSAAMSGTGDHRRRVVELALQSTDCVLRLWGIRDATEELPDHQLRAALEVLIADRFMPVRRAALCCVIRRFPEEAPVELSNGLLDDSRGMREFCRYHLRKMGMAEFAHVYRDKLENPEYSLVAVAGLGETGELDDAQELLPYLTSQRVRIRCAATRAVGRLATDSCKNDLVVRLQDDSKKVAIEAARCLKDAASPIEYQELMAILRTDCRQHVRLAIVDLLEARETWSALPYLLEAAASNDEVIVNKVQHTVLCNVNRVFTCPTKQQQVSIEDALRRFGAHLPPRLLRETTIWFMTRIASRRA